MKLLLWLSLSLWSQPADTLSPYPYQQIGKKEGLSNSAITSIYMDKSAYVWFGSWDGLNRYDGSTIKTYKPSSLTSGSLSNNVIRQFLEDKSHNLWIVTHRGINVYNRDTDQFIRFFDDDNKVPIVENNIRATLGPDSTLYISVIGQGIFAFNDSIQRFEKITIPNVSSDWENSIVTLGYANGIMYYIGSDGVLIGVHQQKIILQHALEIKNTISTFQFAEFGDQPFIALGTNTGEVILKSLSNTALPSQHFNLGNEPISVIAQNLNKDGLWIGTDLGTISYLTQKNHRFEMMFMRSAFPLLSNTKRKIISITETPQQLLWVGTDGAGVYKFLTRQKPFSTVVDEQNKPLLNNTIVRAILEDHDGTLYVGTRGDGLLKIQNNKIIHSLLPNNTVLALAKDFNKNLWIGVDGEGIYMLEVNTNKLFHFKKAINNSIPISFGNVYSICVDVYGTLWLGTSGSGVIAFKTEKQRDDYVLTEFKQITHNNDLSTSSINTNVVYKIIEEGPNILWFGTRGAGSYRYNTLTQKIVEHLHASAPLPKRISNDDVLSMLIVNETLWIGTSDGINQVTLSGNPTTLNMYTERDGLSNNTIHAIQKDNLNQLWLSTNSGLVRFNYNTKTFKNFDFNDGLQNEEYTDGASNTSHNTERLYFGGINGLDIIYPNKIDTSSFYPSLSITEFQIHNKTIQPNDSSNILAQHINTIDTIELNHNQNFISIHFTTLNYWNKQRTQYAYYLKNFDNDWNYIGQQSQINLTNIQPGKYKLFINYTNENGVWSNHPKTLTIIINPPFWKTNWAYSLYVILLIGLQIGIIMFIRQRAHNKRVLAINKFKIQQQNELNDYKLEFFTNVAHEFRTPLTLILGPLPSLLRKVSNTLDREQLTMMYNNALRLQKLIQELIHFRKIENGKEFVEVTEIEIINFTHTIVQSFQQHAEDHNVTIEFIPGPEQLYGWIDPLKCEKILINLISNAIKYNIEGGSVEVRINRKDDFVIFEIQDTGIGIDEHDLSKIFLRFYQRPSQNLKANTSSTGIGLSLTKSLVELHHGSISVDSKIGKGSTFTVTIPILENVYEHSSTSKFEQPHNLDQKILQEFNYIVSESSPVQHRDEEKQYTILIVDDHKQITSLLNNLLSPLYMVIPAHNGEEALMLLEEEKVDLVISDIKMPRMDGLTLCKRIKDNIQTSHIPVILLTAKSEIEDRIEGLQVGADSYIPKPFHPDHLFVRIEQLIKQRDQIKKKFENLANVELSNITPGISARDDEFFLKIKKCIEKHLSEPEFTADIIADEVGMSKTSLYKKVKATVGLTPHGLIKQYRLSKAAELLKNTNMSVSEVIFETGFNSRSYFYKSFNEMFHCHPKDIANNKES
jgi:signal transduction histidine kinase/DNA-binding response OmpR family regulator/ligand-binding sensor domain-containing protein